MRIRELPLHHARRGLLLLLLTLAAERVLRGLRLLAGAVAKWPLKPRQSGAVLRGLATAIGRPIGAAPDTTADGQATTQPRNPLQPGP